MGCNSQPSVGEKPRIVFVIGGPGCGKGTQCKRIVQNFKYQSFSTGDLLSQYVKDKKDGYEDLDKQMKVGKLISSSTLMKVLKEYIINSENKKILVDGYPRNQENIDVWEKEMKDLVEVKGALYIEVSNEEMKKRLLGRNEGRADDNEETIAKRLTTFEKETKPIIQYFEKQGNLIKIDGMKTVDEISKEIGDKFKEKGLN